MRRLCKRGFSPLATCLVFMVGLSLFFAPLAAKAGNRVVAWGAGTITNTVDGYDFGQSVIPASLTNAVYVAGGGRHTLALKADGTLQTWGDSSAGQASLPAGSNYVAIACGYLDSVLLQTNGTVLVVGDNGDPVANPNYVPPGLSNVVAVAAGRYHCLALKADGTVTAWGTSTNPNTYVADVDYGQSAVPAGLSNVVAIAAGAYHSLALKADGTVTGWGRTDYGQANTSGLSNVVAIAAGFADSLALEANGKVVAWGDNTFGQMNIPSGLSNVVAIASGWWHNLALKSNGTVTAWGAGGGSNPYVDYKQTNVPAGLTNVVQIAAGSAHSLALVGSAPPVTEAAIVSPSLGTNGFSFWLPTQNGRVYQLEFKNSLTNDVWQSLPLKAGTGGPLQWTDSAAASMRFYRVSRW
jgi:hypothetical protein